MSSVIGRDQLDGPVLAEFERLYAWLRAILRQQHNDDGGHRLGQWTEYTPGWTVNNGDPAPVIGDGQIVARHTRVGDTVTVVINVFIGANTVLGTSSSAWVFSLPYPPKDPRRFTSVGQAWVGVIGADNIGLVTAEIHGRISAKIDAGVISDTLPGWSAGDALYIQYTYEAVAQ